jgi:hypothetical protein
VFKENDEYKMIYSYRHVSAYRTDPKSAYRLGYAESADGVLWQRRDDEIGIERSESGWDSQMMEYSSVSQTKDHLLMLYNGNGFGRSGFGYAIRAD